MGSAIFNIIGIFSIVVLTCVFVLGLSVLDAIKDAADEVYDPSQSALTSAVSTEYDNLSSFAVQALNFILVVLVLFSFYSAFVNRGDLMSYLVNFIGGIIIAAIVLYVSASFYNSFTSIGAGVGIDLTKLPSWFFSNLGTIIFANLFAGGVSFIYTKRVSGT